MNRQTNAPEQDASGRWVGAMTLCHTNLARFAIRYDNQTLRTAVRINVGGTAVRVRVSNRYGRDTLQIGAAAVAISDARGVPGTDPVPLLFNGMPWVRLNPGEERLSQAAALTVRPGDWVSVDLHLPGRGRLYSGNLFPLYHRLSDEGMQVGETHFRARHSFLVRGLSQRLLPVPVAVFSGLDVWTDTAAQAVVAFGDSITALNQWTGPLADRLIQEYPGQLALLNQGISGNRLRYDSANTLARGIYGPAGVLRFEKDVLSQSGVSTVITLIGVNDLLQPGLTAPREQEADAESLIDGMRALIHLSHMEGVRILGGTITPFGGYLLTHTPEREKVRQTVNHWIREGHEFDGIIDFDAAIRDPVRPERITDGWHLGDRLHPNAQGGKMMAALVDPDLLLKPRITP